MRASAVSTNSRLVVRPAARSAASVARGGLVCPITPPPCPPPPVGGGGGGGPAARGGGGWGGRRSMLWNLPTSPLPSPPPGAERERRLYALTPLGSRPPRPWGRV